MDAPMPAPRAGCLDAGTGSKKGANDWETAGILFMSGGRRWWGLERESGQGWQNIYTSRLPWFERTQNVLNRPTICRRIKPGSGHFIRSHATKCQEVDLVWVAIIPPFQVCRESNWISVD